MNSAVIMTRLLPGVVLFCLIAGGAKAQTVENDLIPAYNEPPIGTDQIPYTLRVAHGATGNRDLDFAVKACDRHSYPSNMVIDTNPPQPGDPVYDRGWEMCTRVLAEWQKSDAARQQREAAERDARDLAAVKAFVEGLGK